jgi:glycoprotein-N-acetylgalactosamine 3-beta-galactosyltransferase
VRLRPKVVHLLIIDLILGACLDKEAIFVNELDELKQKRFFPAGVRVHFGENLGYKWYRDYLWYNTTQGNLRCCSDTFCVLHYVDPEQMFRLEYLIYHVHPFGVDKNSTEKLPRKFSLKEIIAASDIKGWGKIYSDHEPVHHLDSSEYF